MIKLYSNTNKVKFYTKKGSVGIIQVYYTEVLTINGRGMMAWAGLCSDCFLRITVDGVIKYDGRVQTGFDKRYAHYYDNEVGSITAMTGTIPMNIQDIVFTTGIKMEAKKQNFLIHMNMHVNICFLMTKVIDLL